MKVSEKMLEGKYSEDIHAKIHVLIERCHIDVRLIGLCRYSVLVLYFEKIVFLL